MSEPQHVVYKVTNLVNGKIYIGKTTKGIKIRWQRHKAAAQRQDPNDYSILHRAMNKYGFDKFKIEVLEVCVSAEASLEAEKRQIAGYKATDRDIGYNQTEGGDGTPGHRHTEDSKQRMSVAKKGKYQGKDNSFYGKSHSIETIQKVSGENWFKGRKNVEETLAKLHANQGVKPAALTDDQVLVAREAKEKEGVTNRQLAERFGVSLVVMQRAIAGKGVYKHLGPAQVKRVRPHSHQPRIRPVVVKLCSHCGQEREHYTKLMPSGNRCAVAKCVECCVKAYREKRVREGKVVL